MVHQITLEMTNWTDSGFEMLVSSSLEDITLTAHYGADRLGSMVATTKMMLRGSNEVSFCFINTPEAYDWRLFRTTNESDVVNVEIDFWHGWRSHPPIPLLRERCSILRWVRQVKGIASFVKQRVSEETYHRQTRSFFPNENLQILDDFLKNNKRQSS